MTKFVNTCPKKTLVFKHKQNPFMEPHPNEPVYNHILLETSFNTSTKGVIDMVKLTGGRYIL